MRTFRLYFHHWCRVSLCFDVRLYRQAVSELTNELSVKTDDIEMLKAQMADKNQVRNWRRSNSRVVVTQNFYMFA